MLIQHGASTTAKNAAGKPQAEKKQAPAKRKKKRDGDR